MLQGRLPLDSDVNFGTIAHPSPRRYLVSWLAVDNRPPAPCCCGLPHVPPGPGYQVSRDYLSMARPDDNATYVLEVVDGGDAPVFRITVDDQPDLEITGKSPGQAWSQGTWRGGRAGSTETYAPGNERGPGGGRAGYSAKWLYSIALAAGLPVLVLPRRC